MNFETEHNCITIPVQKRSGSIDAYLKPTSQQLPNIHHSQ